MGDPVVDLDADKIKVESGEANMSWHLIMAMKGTLKAAQEAGGLTQDDMISLLGNWIKLTMHFQRGGEANRLRVGVVKDARTQALAFAKSKGGYLTDRQFDPKEKLVVQSYEDRDNPPDERVVLDDKLTNLNNAVYTDHEWPRMSAFNEAEGAFGVLYWNYRIKLAARPDADQHFRNLVARLRNGHVLR
jgi:hypothetical protein